MKYLTFILVFALVTAIFSVTAYIATRLAGESTGTEKGAAELGLRRAMANCDASTITTDWRLKEGGRYVFVMTCINPAQSEN